LSITSCSREKVPGYPRFYVLQATKSWAGPGDEAIVVMHHREMFLLLFGLL